MRSQTARLRLAADLGDKGMIREGECLADPKGWQAQIRSLSYRLVGKNEGQAHPAHPDARRLATRNTRRRD